MNLKNKILATFLLGLTLITLSSCGGGYYGDEYDDYPSQDFQDDYYEPEYNDYSEDYYYEPDYEDFQEDYYYEPEYEDYEPEYYRW